MRCLMCGKKMIQVYIDGITCLQCPRNTCRWVEQIAQETESPVADGETVDGDQSSE